MTHIPACTEIGMPHCRNGIARPLRARGCDDGCDDGSHKAVADMLAGSGPIGVPV